MDNGLKELWREALRGKRSRISRSNTVYNAFGFDLEERVQIVNRNRQILKNIFGELVVDEVKKFKY